jgi:hypothetical protein
MKLLYVLGRGRSGSTVFANVLGELDGFFSGGEIRVNHTIAGNPSRFVTGVVHLEDKREWRHAQTRMDRWVTTAVALPFLRRYGYPIHVGPEPADSGAA